MAVPIFQTTAPQESWSTGLGQGLSSVLQGLAQNKVRQMQGQQSIQVLQGLGIPQQQAAGIAQLPEQLQQLALKEALEIPQQEAFAQALGSLLGQEPAGSPQGELPADIASAAAPEGAVQSQAEPFLRAGLKQQQAVQLAQLGLQQKQMGEKLSAAERKERAQAFKETKAERKEIIQQARSARDKLQDLDRLEELQKEGKLNTPGYAEFLKRSGLDIPALMNPGSQEFEKITANFIKDARSVFGSRISNFELESFLKTLPNLSQSPEGRKRVIANLKKVSRGQLEYRKALDKEMKENKGIPPLDLMERVESRVDKKMDKIASLFKEDLKKEVPKGQSKLATELMAIAGSVIGAPGQLIKAVGGLIGR